MILYFVVMKQWTTSNTVVNHRVIKCPRVGRSSPWGGTKAVWGVFGLYSLPFRRSQTCKHTPASSLICFVSWGPPEAQKLRVPEGWQPCWRELSLGCNLHLPPPRSPFHSSPPHPPPWRTVAQSSPSVGLHLKRPKYELIKHEIRTSHRLRPLQKGSRKKRWGLRWMLVNELLVNKRTLSFNKNLPAAMRRAVSLTEPRPAAMWRGVEPLKVQQSTLAFPWWQKHTNSTSCKGNSKVKLHHTKIPQHWDAHHTLHRSSDPSSVKVKSRRERTSASSS